MRAFHDIRGHRVMLLAAASVLVLGLAACSSDDAEDAGAGTPFTQALAKNYGELSAQAAALPADAAESSFWDSLNPFSDSETSSQMLAKDFNAKADMAAGGGEPGLEDSSGPGRAVLRGRVEKAVAANKDQFPEQAARAQADYDCWIIYGTVPSAAPASQACKAGLDVSLVRLETAAHPVAPPSAGDAPPVSTPLPPPVPVAPAPVARVSNDFTVYFDFDSWTLKAEQLTVLDQVIATARSGGQGNINIVGHTDTSGTADYNQRLSVHRANVVAEALVKMGARRGALHASGVGETDLAVETGDGVKEAKNRRTVIALQP